MVKRVLAPLEKVSNVELFYDLIFVYLISTAEGLMHRPLGGFFSLEIFFTSTVVLLIILEVWFHTTILLNRYGDDSLTDNACMFSNMFALYFMGESIGFDWKDTAFVFALSWTAVLANLLLHWWLKNRIYENLDEDDHAIIRRSMVTIAAQLASALISLALPAEQCVGVCALSAAAGLLFWALDGTLGRKPANFEHLAERCSLLVIVTFGETVVSITAYMQDISVNYLPYQALIFALVVGLFLVYVFEYDRLLDLTTPRRGTRFMAIHAMIVIVLANLTVAIEYMADTDVAFLPKSGYITCCLVLYLLTTLRLAYYHKERFAVRNNYYAIRIAICVIVTLCALLSDFDVTYTLVAETLCVWAALAHEATLYVFRTRLADVGPNTRAHVGDGEDHEDEPERGKA